MSPYLERQVPEYQRMADITFLALTIWREARSECDECRAAVAACIVERTKRPARYGNGYMGVVTKPRQFSSLTDPKDRQLTTYPKANDQAWIECMRLAVCAVSGLLQHPAPKAQHYYDQSIPAPKWATPENFVRKIGRINFHNLDKDTTNV